MEPSIFFDEVNERQGVFHRRAFLLGGFAGMGLLAMAGRLTELQLVQANRYQTLSASNQFNFRLRPPPRGRILDRNGVEIASNRPDFRLMVQRDEHTDVDDLLNRLGELIPISEDRRSELRKDIVNAPRYAPVVVANDLSWEEFSRVNVRAPELPGVTAEVGDARVYPYGGAFAHVIGYVSKITRNELDAEGPNPDPLVLNPSFRIGKQGVEKAFEKELRGKAGAQKMEVDSMGRVIREDPQGDIPSTPGKEVVLSLDADIQNRALEVFGDQSGGAVLMDVHTGDVLCLCSAPAFDPNRFVTGIPTSEYSALSNYERKPLLDKALYGTYPPGSTFKTMVALAALESGIDPRLTHTCTGAWAFGNHVFHCDEHHGTLDMKAAIATSCDIFFYQTALAVGPDKIAEVARRFGLGEVFDIGISGQRRGIIPDQAWKKAYFHTPANQKWYPGETPSMGIGQGYVNVNPLQLCVMAARIANGEKALNPRLIKSVGGVEQPSGAAVPDLQVDKDHIRFVREAMAAVTTTGTAALVADLGLGPVKMAGKTGTAQAFSYRGGRGAHGAVGDWKLRDHAWFIAFAPYDDPRYALSVLVEHGGFGAQAAAPRAREIMRVALLKDPQVRARIEQPLPLPDLPAQIPNEGGLPAPPELIGPAIPGDPV